MDDKKKIEFPESEIDVPPSTTLIKPNDITDLSPSEKRDWLKWLKNFSLVRLILYIMIGLYIADIITAVLAPNAIFALKEPFFEVLKVLLFTASGYIFSKNPDK